MSLKKKIIIFFIVLFLSVIFVIFIVKNDKTNEKIEIIKDQEKIENLQTNSNIIKDVNYTTKDTDGNEYIINALQGEIDYKKPNIIYLTNVSALIKLKNSEIVTITSNFGKYNSENYDTIFSKNVIINYLDNKILGEYLDFSLIRNTMIISKDVIYTNINNILKADVIEMDIKTKDTKIYMYENKNKVNIKSKN